MPINFPLNPINFPLNPINFPLNPINCPMLVISDHPPFSSRSGLGLQLRTHGLPQALPRDVHRLVPVLQEEAAQPAAELLPLKDGEKVERCGKVSDLPRSNMVKWRFL